MTLLRLTDDVYCVNLQKAESKTGESKESVSLSDSMEVSSSHEGVRPVTIVTVMIRRDT